MLKIKTVIPPLSPNIIPRIDVLHQLNKDLMGHSHFSRQLTLLSAPAGYGKTTLAREWISTWPDAVAWLSLDEADNAHARYWLYLIDALQTVQQNLGKSAAEVLQADKSGFDGVQDSLSFLVPLLNDLAVLEQPLIVVLDDYHLIHHSVIHEQMIFFIENMPPCLHLVITTRSDPPWPLFRWRAKNILLDVRLNNLAFSEKETICLFAQSGAPQLQDDQIKTLHEKTEGWIAGLKLAVLSLLSSENPAEHIRQFAGSNRHILHFLIDEVFRQQPEPVQTFLLQTAVLTRLCGPLCDAVTGQQNSTEMLDQMERVNLFVIPLDDRAIWFRYHPLFADVLAIKLRQQQPEQIAGLYKRASLWFLTNGEPGEAARQALAGHHTELAGQILHDHSDEMLRSDGPALQHSIVHQLPDVLKKRFPRLMAFMALYQLIHQGRVAAETYLALADQLCYQDDREQQEYLGILAAVKAYFCVFISDYKQALSHAGKADRMLSRNNHYWRMNAAIYLGDARLFSGNAKEAYPHYLEAQMNSRQIDSPVLNLNTGFKVATSLLEMGRLSEAEKLTLDLLGLARQRGLSALPRTGLLWTLYGEILREKGQLDEARSCIGRGIVYSESEKPCLGWNYLFEVALHYSAQAYTDALHTLKEIELLNLEVKLPPFITLPAAIWQARIFLATGQMNLARECLSEAGISQMNAVQPGQERGYLTLAECMLADEPVDPEAIDRLLDILATLAIQSSSLAVLIEARLVQAGLAEKTARTATAERLLGEALQIGRQAGYRQLFLNRRLNLDSVYVRMYSGSAGRTVSADDITAIIHTALNAMPPERAALPGMPAFDTQEKNNSLHQENELVEKLSARELEVLERISQGLSNQEISDQLYLSLGTVKWHSSNIYGKLGVRGRTQAVAQARQMGLIR